MISQGSQFGLGTWMLKYSREYEKQADILGVQMMARAGYDPRDLARVFENIEKQGGSGAPQWMSNHPNPGNRSAYIAQEARMVRCRPSRQRQQRSPARQAGDGGVAARPSRWPTWNGRPAAVEAGGEAPASVGTHRRPGARAFVLVSQRARRQPVPGERAVELAGGCRRKQRQVRARRTAWATTTGESVFTHGVEVGVARATSRDLNEATEALLQAFAQGNPNLRERAGTAGHAARAAPRHRALAREPIGAPAAREYVGLYTTFLSDGNVFYYLTVAPDEDLNRFTQTFQRIGNSIRLNDR